MEEIKIKTNDFVKFITEQLVTYMHLPAEERKKRRKYKQESSGYTSKWFGIVPFAIRTMWKKAE